MAASIFKLVAHCAMCFAMLCIFASPVAAGFATPVSSSSQATKMALRSLTNAEGMEFVEPEPRMSGAVIHNGIIHTAGMVCEEGGEGKDVKQQTKDALEELERVLVKCGSDKHHLLSMQVWIDKLEYLADMNAVYDEWVSKKGAPGRACVVSQLIPPYKVEFRAVAVKLE